MKKHLLKTLLVATGLLAGSVNSWGQTTSTADVKMTYVDGESGNEEKQIGEITSGSTATTGYNNISNNSVTLANPTWPVNYITYIQVDASKIDGKITNANLSFDVSGSTDSKRTATYGVGYNASSWSETLTYSTADRSITLLGGTQGTSTKSAATFETKTFDITDAFKNDDDKIVTILVYATTPAGGYIKNPTAKITTVPESATMTSYTIKYVDEKGVELKTATSNEIAVGVETSATKDDMQSFINEGTKYVYKEGNTTIKTVEEASHNVITLTFREAATYTYTINCITGNTKKEIKGSALEGETVKVGYPYYLLSNGILYKSDKKYSSDGKGYQLSMTMTEDNLTKDIVFKETDIRNISYFSEAEDIDGLTLTTNGNTAIRSSMGGSAYAKDGNVEFTKLPAGKYKLTACVCDASGKTANSTWNFFAGENNIYSFNVTNINWQEGTSEEFTLTEETPILIGQGGSGNAGIDYLYIQKLGEVANVTAAKYATYVTSGAVKVPANAKVMTAKVENNKLVTTTLSAGTVIPANTAIIVNAEEAGDVSFEMAGENGSIKDLDNDLQASTGVTADGTQYCLTEQDGKVGFGKVKAGVVIPAGKAYLVVNEQAAANFFAFDGTVTAIKNVETSATADGAYYTLQGVKVEKPTKGIYVHNGKKVIIK